MKYISKALLFANEPKPSSTSNSRTTFSYDHQGMPQSVFDQDATRISHTKDRDRALVLEYLENRMCQCLPDIQTEEHILLYCSLSRNIKLAMNIDEITLEELFQNDNAAEYCYKILNYYRTYQ